MATDSETYKPKILIVDDNNDNIQLALTLLKRQDYDIEYSLTGEEALDRVKTIKPDLILLDIMMPEMDGFEVCQLLKENPETQDIPVIFLSARSEVESIVKGFSIGGADYITKPFKQLELIARINTHLNVRQSQKLIVEQNQKLLELNKDKDFLMQITAHDLKNPISGIAGLLDYIGENYGRLKSEEVIDIIETAKYGLNSSMNIIGDLLDSYALETGKFKLNLEVFDINSLVQKICSQHLKRAQSKSINFVCSISNAYCYIEADKSKTARILDNIISNSIKYSHENTDITINSVLIDGFVTVVVSDSGPGFNQNDLQNMYQKYTTLSAKPTGREISTGLGLYIVKRLTTAMNAEINIENSPNGGAEFRLTFRVV